jgi:cyclomaltodextrinase
MDPDAARPEPQWVEHAIWWQIYPLGFTGADTTGADRDLHHRLAQLTGWLDYAVTLGASGIALGPIFAAGTHGYDTIDHLQIDPRLGDERDFAGLLQAAHSRGLRVILDGVFNHVGRDFAASQPDWYLTDGVNPDGTPSLATFEGHHSLVTFDHSNPQVIDYVFRVMNHWLEMGADGWRLDAAYAVPQEFWAAVLPQIRINHPDAYLVGEVIHGDYGSIVRNTHLDAVTQYELWKAIWSSINDRNFFELSWAVERHDALLESTVPLTFLGNHDVTRIASNLADIRHLPHALVILLTLGGTPSIYYGDEQAFRGIKEERLGGDDEIRPAFPAAPEALLPDGAPTFRLHQHLIGLRRRHPWLHRATTTTVLLANQQYGYDIGDGTTSLRVLLNLADDPLVLTDVEREVLAGSATYAASDVIVPPHEWAVLS